MELNGGYGIDHKAKSTAYKRKWMEASAGIHCSYLGRAESLDWIYIFSNKCSRFSSTKTFNSSKVAGYEKEPCVMLFQRIHIDQADNLHINT